jgi:tRNA dimethylallyltransferase
VTEGGNEPSIGNRRLPEVICLMGPTAAGKTELAVKLVELLPCEIVSVDSTLVYRGLDIGSAKPGPQVLARAPHRLIDIRDPAQAYSAAEFRRDALEAIEEIRRAGRIPLLVGGTMLYFRALLQGLSPLPAADPQLRARLASEAKRLGWQVLHARLARLDPESAARIHPHDPQRIQRALEIVELTGRPRSELFARRTDQSLSYRKAKIVVAPADRGLLHERIALRFERMLAAGLVAEVESLYNRGDLSLDKPALRAVGYRQVWEYLDGTLDYRAMCERGVAATRQLARRQLVWLRAEPETRWLDSRDPALARKVLDYLHGA